MVAKGVLAISAIAVAVLGGTIVNHRNTAYSSIEAAGAGSRDSKPAPVLVELFTSEGCSSCPPADEMLTRLEQTQPIAGAEVIALSEHVDYWNRLGWTDPYSSSEFSARQNDYARAFDTDEVYTPQMIVDGRAQFVGSNFGRAREAIASAARDLKAAVMVSLASQDPASVTLAVRIESLPEIRADDEAQVLVAITEGGLRSNVSRGENAGRHLSHTAVVRKLLSLGRIESQKGTSFIAQPILRIDKSWKRDNLKGVVFVQERASRRVLGAAAVALGK